MVWKDRAVPRSLKRAGALNSARVHAAAMRIVTDDVGGTMHAFLALASASAFSTNVSADKIAVFDERGAILDARAVRVHEASGDEDAASRVFEEEQGDWLVRREGFEALWRHGPTFVYGAVNAGGMGAARPRFGPFCLVVSDPAAGADEIAVLPADSARRYCSPSGVVDEQLARSEAVTWRHRGHLATIERADDVAMTPPAGWPQLICSPRRYLEAIVTPGPPLGSIDAVRIRNEHLVHLEDLKLAGVDSGVEPSAEQRELIAFEALNRWRAEHQVGIEGVG